MGTAPLFFDFFLTSVSAIPTIHTIVARREQIRSQGKEQSRITMYHCPYKQEEIVGVEIPFIKFDMQIFHLALNFLISYATVRNTDKNPYSSVIPYSRDNRCTS